MKNVLYVIVPCYNEEEVLNITSKKLKEKMEILIKNKYISENSKVLFVDDGSKDNTWNIIKKLHDRNNLFRGIKLSHNKGNQLAQYAGFMYAKKYADMAISFEADLQDDINVIDKMIEEYNDGAEIVYGVRSARKKDTFFKRITAAFYYKLMNIIGVEMIPNHSECRLLSKVALESLSQYKETNIFLRSIVPQLGYKTSIVSYERGARVAGKTKFSLKKMFKFAFNGIVASSVAPLRWITYIGVLMFLISIVFLTYDLIILILGHVVHNLLVILPFISFIISLNIIAMGIVGEYIGKIYEEVKMRPRYIVEEELL